MGRSVPDLLYRAIYLRDTRLRAITIPAKNPEKALEFALDHVARAKKIWSDAELVCVVPWKEGKPEALVNPEMLKSDFFYRRSR